MHNLKRFISTILVFALCAGTLTGCSGSSLRSVLREVVSDESSQVTVPEQDIEVEDHDVGWLEGLFRSETEDSDGVTDSLSNDVVEPAEGLSGFACDQLNDAEKSAYGALYAGISEKKDSFTIRADSSDDIKTALSAIMTDHPEFFWLTGSAQMSGYSSLGIWTIYLDFNIDASQIDPRQVAIEEKVQDFLNSIPEDATNYERVKRAYEYIISNTDYDSSSEQNQNIQSVFLNGLSVCAGYARAFKYLCDRMSIYCAYVEGTVERDGSSAGHAWDLVEIDGVMTYVDPSWGDPTYDADDTDSRSLDIIYDDLCLTTAEMERNHHKASGEWSLPECTDRTYDYYVLNGCYYEGYSEEALSSALWKAVNEGESVVLMKFSDFESYAQAMAALFPGEGGTSLLRAPLQQRMEWDSRNSMQYYYSYSDELLTIKIYW